MNINKHFIFDFDSTLVSVESMDIMVPIVCKRRYITDSSSLTEKITDITNLAMNGELGFSEALQKRLELLQLTTEDITELIPILKSKLSESVLNHFPFFKEHQDHIFVISGGFEEYIIPVVKEIGILESHVFANRFISSMKENFLTCDTEIALSKNQGKLHALQSLPLKGDILVIGDGYTDYEMKKYRLADRFYLYTEHVDRSNKITEYDACIQSIDELIAIEHG